MYDALPVLDQLNTLVQDFKSSSKRPPEGPVKDILQVSGGIIRGVTNGLLEDVATLVKDTNQVLINQVDEGTRNVNQTTLAIRQTLTDQVNNQVQGVGDDILKAIITVLGNIIAGITNISNAVGNIAEDVVDGVSDLIEDITGGIPDLIQALKDKIQGLIDVVSGIGTNIKDTLIGIVTNIGNWVRTQITNAIAAVANWLNTQIQEVKEWFDTTITNVKEWLVDSYNNVSDWLTKVYNSAKDNITAAIEGFKGFVEVVKDTVQDKIDALMLWLTGVKEDLTATFQNMLKGVSEFINTEILPRITAFNEGIQEVIKLFQDIWSLVGSGDYQSAFDALDSFFTERGIPGPVQTIHAIVSTLAYFWMTVNLQFIPMQVAAQKNAIIGLAMESVPLEAVAQSLFKGTANESQFYENARLAGVTAERARHVLEASKALPTPGSIQEAFLRGEIDEQEHDFYLKSYGYQDQDISLFKALYYLIPPPNDLIRMSVREVFSPEIAEQYGQFEDFPQAFLSWANKIGLSDEWAKNYWAAHWDLPSPQMGFQMLHRGIIDTDELKLLLRSLDVMPYWRERLIKLSYNPLTRVDVRRMYQLGVITEDQVYTSYLDLGYDSEKATWLTEFTKRYSAPEDESELSEFRSLARSVYSQAYQKRIISKDEYFAFLSGLNYHPDDINLLISLDDFKTLQADKLFSLQDYRKDFLKLTLQAYDRGLLHVNEISPMLADLGYSDGEISLEVGLADYNRELGIRNLIVSKVRDQYIDFIIDLVQVHTILDMFNFTSDEIGKLQETWDIERNFRTKRPPLTELRKFFTAGLLTLDEFLDELRGQGYHEKYINMYKQTLVTG